ncbi:hypothetical protein [Cryptosporangium aurantiacum]|uniref:Uncharacterized protein n=1 Tax=Cryptosporangium aurantiacum TaxID=134849 RepID=A0A1M7TXD5_9ACTN|nr:hypothetical protein [Cryptosporangium aurantiacum]SHN75409.1 hypothetical protein SAMN05443668_107290 [Cryptosporangium aurantiacum]
MGWVELTEGPDGLRSRATQLSGQADAFAARLSSLLAQIAAVEAGSPQGVSDDYARAFNTNYNKPTDGGPLHEAIDNQARDLGPEATTIGNALSAGATDYEIGDLQAENDINSVI